MKMLKIGDYNSGSIIPDATIKALYDAMTAVSDLKSLFTAFQAFKDGIDAVTILTSRNPPYVNTDGTFIYSDEMHILDSASYSYCLSHNALVNLQMADEDYDYFMFMLGHGKIKLMFDSNDEVTNDSDEAATTLEVSRSSDFVGSRAIHYAISNSTAQLVSVVKLNTTSKYISATGGGSGSIPDGYGASGGNLGFDFKINSITEFKKFTSDVVDTVVNNAVTEIKREVSKKYVSR